jgi:hypothetical protein
MQEFFSLIAKKLLPSAKKKYFDRPIILGDPLPNAALPQAEQQLLHSLCTWTRRAIVRANGLRCLRDEGNSALRVARRDRRMNAAADIEIADDGHLARLAGLNEIVENLVDHGFVESAFVAIGPQIELQRFELDAKLIGNVMDSDRGKIRLSRARTNTGELGTFHFYVIVAFRARVDKGLELFTRSGCHQRILARRKTISKPAR